jgi:hypothetical protein
MTYETPQIAEMGNAIMTIQCSASKISHYIDATTWTPANLLNETATAYEADE